jgi:hypothetical protein
MPEISRFYGIITRVAVVGSYTLLVVFSDGVEQTIDFAPVLYGHYYGALRDPDRFNQVQIDPDFHTLIWPNDADFDPMTLYHWHDGAGDELIQRARTWQTREVEKTELAQQVTDFIETYRPALEGLAQ